ncbi:diacylglycerol kinase accessory domain protein [Dictyocaulus viviparus]|uniref:Diacylglycerol kinase accessory domain protein n=1 Tax=Dictyocaulus viviparus TaxID=29172 RepID=A0A0D8XJJ2_DICVI|nr:diacylglycerol kinase accessory domain protein [Dictyocaulus viviparus]
MKKCIVILNIPSYSGGANFWGNAKDDTFRAQSFDDRLLEVVALFGVIHVATSRVPNVVRLQNHRIAQCRHIRIIILGNDPIPVQVDGEPWLQPPGILQIVHKNRAQLLVRNAAFDAILKRWEEQKERTMTPSTPTSLSLSVAACEEFSFAQRAGAFVQLVESEIAQLGVSSGFLEALEAAVLSVRAVEDEKMAVISTYMVALSDPVRGTKNVDSYEFTCLKLAPNASVRLAICCPGGRSHPFG